MWGSVQGFDAQVTVFWNRPPQGVEPVVLSDLYPHGSVGDVPTCADVGVLGALCLQVGSLLATEAIKLIAGIGEPLLGRVLVIDGLRARQHEVRLRSDGGGRMPAPPAPSAQHVDANPQPRTPAPRPPLRSSGPRPSPARSSSTSANSTRSRRA